MNDISALCLSFAVVKVDIPAPRTKSGDLMVEFEEIELIHRDLLTVCTDLVNAPSQRGWVHWSFEPEFCRDADGDDVITIDSSGLGNDEPMGNGDRHGQLYPCVSELWTSDWWRNVEGCISSVGDVKRIFAVGIATDETAITLTGE